MNVSSNFLYHLAHTSIGEITPRFHKIWSVHQSESLQDALEVLIENKISSVPVYGDLRTNFIFFLDFSDILSFIVDDLSNPEKIKQTLKNTLCSNCLSRLNKKSITVNHKSTIQEVIDLFASHHGALHRVAVLDEHNQFDSILSQSRIVRYIGNRPDYDVGEFTRQTVQSIGIGNSPVISIEKNEKVIQAFLKMFNVNVSGIAVVNKKNKLIGNISLSDLKAIGSEAEMSSKMMLTAKDFILQQECDDYPKLIVVTPQDTFQHVFWHLRSKWTHRVYVINNKEKKECMSVITTFDILRMFESKK